jgi:hypothetical protein
MSEESTKCVICGKECIAKVRTSTLKQAHERTTEHIAVEEAAIFSSIGNYGSKVWDPTDETLVIECFICDQCIKEKIKHFTVRRHTKRVSLEEPLDKFLKDEEEFFKSLIEDSVTTDNIMKKARKITEE